MRLLTAFIHFSLTRLDRGFFERCEIEDGNKTRRREEAVLNEGSSEGFMSDSLIRLLKESFGYGAFRPLQREIIETSLAGRDVLAILPTGAGKSLCFQLPALAREGLMLVVSPLIALMKDQVDALIASGVSATVLNSSLSTGEACRRREGLERGEYKLLYAAPERVMMEGFIQDLRRWNVTAVAVDEAHCISEWGHDFRPEYRQLAQLREELSGVPFLALTATATERVRLDISRQLHLREPEIFLASFNRPNLNYSILPKKAVTGQVLDFVRSRPEDSGIVYVQSRKSAESLASALVGEGIKAVAYHAGLQPEERATNQEAFIRDEAQVVCATIAFGMGINKPDVRFVIHADLPKNIEAYYQETGRAGRDGLPSDCILYFSRGDLIRNLKFLDQMTDARAAEVAAQQMRQMADFAESEGCRRAALLRYFGEDWPEENCGGCDACIHPREVWDATVPVQKLLSCVFRIRQKSGFATGLKHVVEVLAGAATEKIRKWGHGELTTYGIGQETSREEWMMIGRQLIHLGYLQVSGDAFQTLDLSEKGRMALKERVPISLRRAREQASEGGRVSRSSRAGYLPCDEGLFEQLRQLRKRLADERGVPPYVVFGDTSLRHMCREYPHDEPAFLAIPGVGRQKLMDYGTHFMGEIRGWLDDHPPQTFAAENETSSIERRKEKVVGGSALETARLFQSGKIVEEIAKMRGISQSTVLQHLAQCIASGKLQVSPRDFYTPEEEALMRKAAEEHGIEYLAPLHQALGGSMPYEKLHIFRALRTVEGEKGSL